MQAVDTSSPSLARAYDFLLGGRAHFTADRALAGRLQAVYPRTADVLSSSRTHLARCLAALPPGTVSQFIDVGCGLPSRPSVHEAALRARPDARVVYVDHDPAVVSHASTLVPPTVRVIEGDLAEPEALLWALGPLVDFTQPACLIAALVVQALPDLGLARTVVDVLVRALAPGSYVILTAGNGAEGRLPDAVAAPMTAQYFEAFFVGLDLLPPGIQSGPAFGAAARKP